MKLPLSMIKDYVNIPISAEAYAQRMIMTGTAVEGIERLGGEIQNVVVGRVLTLREGGGHAFVAVHRGCWAGRAPAYYMRRAQRSRGYPRARRAGRRHAARPGIRSKKGKLRGSDPARGCCAPPRN